MPALKPSRDTLDRASFPADHSLMTNGGSDSSDIGNPSWLVRQRNKRWGTHFSAAGGGGIRFHRDNGSIAERDDEELLGEHSRMFLLLTTDI